MEPARTGLRKIISDLLRACPADEAVIIAWPLICGREVAARTIAVSFDAGSLTVSVPDRTWRSELTALAPRYVAGFEGLIGPVVREVVFKVAISTQPSALSQSKHSALSTQHSALSR